MTAVPGRVRHIPNFVIHDLLVQVIDQNEQITDMLIRIEGKVTNPMDQREREAWNHYTGTVEKLRAGYLSLRALNAVYRDFFDTLSTTQQDKLSKLIDEAQNDEDHEYDWTLIESADAGLDVILRDAPVPPSGVGSLPTDTVPGPDGTRAVPDPDPTTLPTDPPGHDPHFVTEPDTSPEPENVGRHSTDDE